MRLDGTLTEDVGRTSELLKPLLVTVVETTELDVDVILLRNGDVEVIITLSELGWEDSNDRDADALKMVAGSSGA